MVSLVLYLPEPNPYDFFNGFDPETVEPGETANNGLVRFGFAVWAGFA